MSQAVVYQARKFQVVKGMFPMPDGREVEREIIMHPGAVAMIPLVDEDHVCLVRNYRPTVAATLLEIPAGTLEPGEAPEPAAVRELAEETGFRAKRWRKLAEFHPSPGVLSERMFLYLAQELTPGPTDLEEDECLQTEIVSWGDALRWALDGTIRDAKTLVGILLWDRLRSGSP